MTKVGIEVEYENRQGFDVPNKWSEVGEAMLRNGGEFVLRNPLSGDELYAAMDDLYDKFTVETFSQRCSTHIHIDVRKLTRIQLFNFITLYVVFEPVLMQLLHKTRVGNNFCVPVMDAVGIEEALIRCATGEIKLETLGMDMFKYGSINLASIGRLGSLEFRALHGTGDKHEVRRWIDLHVALKEYATTPDLTPDKIIVDYSERGHLELFNSVGFNTNNQLSQLPDLEDLMHCGMRNAQYFAFSGDWYE